jgi:myo-inositol catabolism protein IolC
MSLGYSAPLYLLPFDHRHSYVSGMFQLEPPLTPAQRHAVIDSKQVIYDGFRYALGGELPVDTAAVLVDEEFGADILHDASRNGYITALSTERTGSAEFEFEYGTAFAAHIEAFQPTFAKALARYNPEGDRALNARQVVRLIQLSDYCHTAGQRFMFELLVPATPAQMERCGGNQEVYDRSIRPALVLQAISVLQDAGVEPDIWKIEGLDRREDCEHVVAVARRGGREEVGCIVLGSHADDEKVIGWLRTAASVRGVTGFAVGRTTFWDAIADYVKNRTTRREAALRVAQRYRRWATVFDGARRTQSVAT